MFVNGDHYMSCPDITLFFLYLFFHLFIYLNAKEEDAHWTMRWLKTKMYDKSVSLYEESSSSKMQSMTDRSC